MDMHRVPFPDFYERLKIDKSVTENGLSQAEAEKRN